MLPSGLRCEPAPLRLRQRRVHRLSLLHSGRRCDLPSSASRCRASSAFPAVRNGALGELGNLHHLANTDGASGLHCALLMDWRALGPQGGHRIRL